MSYIQSESESLLCTLHGKEESLLPVLCVFTILLTAVRTESTETTVTHICKIPSTSFHKQTRSWYWWFGALFRMRLRIALILPHIGGVFSLLSWAESRDCIQRETWCMGPYAGVDYNSLYLLVNSVVSYPFHTHYKGKGAEWGRSFLLVEHFCINLLIPKQPIGKRRVPRRGREGGELTLCIWIDILWSMGNHMCELTLTPCRSCGLNTHKMTMNLGSEKWESGRWEGGGLAEI